MTATSTKGSNDQGSITQARASRGMRIPIKNAMGDFHLLPFIPESESFVRRLQIMAARNKTSVGTAANAWPANGNSSMSTNSRAANTVAALARKFRLRSAGAEGCRNNNTNHGTPRRKTSVRNMFQKFNVLNACQASS